ncbi:MAG: hypothetical protein ACE5HE_01660 [Phycisphaerae bacterium]
MSWQTCSLLLIYFAVRRFAGAPAAAADSDTGLVSVCTQNSECNDDNPCTEDACDPEGQCSNFPNYDVVVECCNPTNGWLTIIECDLAHCYDTTCFPMGCTCCDRPGGDPCAEAVDPTIPASSNWGAAVMALLVVTAGSLLTRRIPRPSTGG